MSTLPIADLFCPDPVIINTYNSSIYPGYYHTVVNSKSLRESGI